MAVLIPLLSLPLLEDVSRARLAVTPEAGALAIEGAAPILTARLVVTVEYLVSDPLTN